MDSNPQPAHGSVKMRANRKVVESRCGICGGDFAFGEEVYSCPACGGYHHTYCLESGTRCPQATAVAAEIQLKHDAFAPPVRWETAPPSEQPSIPTPPSPPRPSSAVPQLSPEALRRRQQIAETYKQWSTEQLERAFGQDRNQYEAIALEVVAEELKTRRLSEPWMCLTCGVLNPAGLPACACESGSKSAPPSAPLGPDERRCPTCAEIIKREALKCRFCGHVLSADVFGGGALVGTALTPEVPTAIAAQIDSTASEALWYSIGSLFCCGPILGPMGISNGNKVIRLLEKNPAYEGCSSARGKARAGQIIGWIAIALFVIGLLSRISGIK
jgi:hypothetical protein